MTARRRLRVLLVVVLSILGVLLVSHALVWVLPPAVAKSGEEILVLLDTEPVSVTISASGLRTTPGRRDLGDSIEVRLQSKGLLVLTGRESAWVLDAPLLRVDWNDRAKLTCESASGDAVTTTQLGGLVIRRRDPFLRVVLRADVEVYLTGVVGAEMGSAFSTEALKAQAVAARSFAWSARARRRDRSWHIRSDATDQVYQQPSQDPDVVRAVRDTAGEMLRWDGKPLRAYYQSTCGGRTRDGRERFRDVPAEPFQSVACTDCRHSPLFRWKRTLLREQVAELGVTGAPIELAPDRTSDRGDWVTFKARALGKSWTELPVGRLSRLVALPSTWLTRTSWTAAGIELEGRGFGHGVGLCQYGADRKARDGMDYREILASYYPGADVR